MSTFELRPSPGAAGGFVSQKRPVVRKTKKSSLQRFSCPCGCGRSGWFSQPRSLRSAAAVASSITPVSTPMSGPTAPG